MIRLIAVLLLVIAAGCSRRGEGSYTYTELAYPGAKSTAASGINAAGHVVGWYSQEDRTYGFVYKDGTFTSVQYPGASLTQVYGIDANGGVSGGFRMPDEKDPMAYHGFLLAPSGAFRRIDHPEFEYGMAMRLLGDGSVVGCFHKTGDIATMRGMTIPASALAASAVTAASVKLIDPPGSMHNGATADGSKIVGMIMPTGQAYLIERGALSTFTVSGAKLTEAWDVNDEGTIVGVFEDSSSVKQGFVRVNGQDTTLRVPNSKSTAAFGINARGDIVGVYETQNGEQRGFIARR